MSKYYTVIAFLFLFQLIARPQSYITIISPNGGENWAAGSTQAISWNDNISENVKIDLYKNGLFSSNIISSTASDGTFNWDIPFTQQSSSDYTIKITSVSDTSVTDASNANFTIVGNHITVTSPNGGENWLESEDQLITWTDNLAGNVQIQLFKAGIFNSSITTSTPSSGSFVWNPPASIPSSSDYTIKISSVVDGAIFDFSDNPFTIINNNITVTSPNGGENWLIGSPYTITWTDDISGEVKIDLYKADTLYSKIAASVASNGSFNWNFAGATPGTDYRIKITSIDQPALFDLSNNDFTLFAGAITITSPNGGESWQAGETHTITWTDNIVENVRIDLYKSETFFSVIDPSTSTNGIYNWDVPLTQEGGSDYKIKISSMINSNVFDLSDSNFNIIQNYITILTPNGGEEWLVGSDYLITWTDNIREKVEIHLYKAGIFHSVIDGSDPSDGSIAWSIPLEQETASDFTIRISNVNNANIFDSSDSVFALIHNITVTSPNGGETWQVNTDQTITWADNLIGNVRIELYKGDILNAIIANSEPSRGVYIWNIDPILEAATDYKIKIVSVADASVFDYSDNDFSISGGEIIITEPSGLEEWQAGSTQLIHWTDNISENVKIELFKAEEFHSIIQSSTSSDGTFAWSIPFAQEGGSDYKVKISSINNPNAFDLSDSSFTIIENYITILTPNGGEIWVIGEYNLITWKDNIAGNIEILLLKNDTPISVIEGEGTSDGSKTWLTPSSVQPGFDYKIQISSIDYSDINDFSDADFTITDVTNARESFSVFPDTYELAQNYPNPFNPSTTIYYALPEAGEVELVIYDVLGNQVINYKDSQTAGYHQFKFDGSDLNSGVYFYRLQAGDPSANSKWNFVETKKMILIK